MFVFLKNLGFFSNWIDYISLFLYFLIIIYLFKKWVSLYVDSWKFELVMFDNYGFYVCYNVFVLCICCMLFELMYFFLGFYNLVF